MRYKALIYCLTNGKHSIQVVFNFVTMGLLYVCWRSDCLFKSTPQLFASYSVPVMLSCGLYQRISLSSSSGQASGGNSKR